MIANFDLYFWSLISADFFPSFKKHLNGQNHKSWFMKAKFWFFMITHFTDCAASGISISQPLWGGIILPVFYVSSQSPLPAPKISPASAVSPILSDGKYKQGISRNTKNANLPASSSARVREGRFNLGVSFLPGQYFFIPTFVAKKGVSEISALLSNSAASGEWVKEGADLEAEIS